MLKQFKNTIGILFLAVVFFMAGCENSDISDTGTPSFGTMEVWMHDDPADFEEVQIFIERVEVNNQENSEGWIVIGEPEQHFDLLELTNGNYEVLGSEQLEAGTYSQVRLIVSRDDNYILENGEVKTLFVPGGSETGVKLNINAEISAGMDYILLLDFDAKRSIVTPASNGQPADYILKPVIRTANLAEAGNIEGVIQPAESLPVPVYALSGEDTLSTTFADEESGFFLLFGLEAGTYTVSVDGSSKGFDKREAEDVIVTTGETNDIGVIELAPAEEEE